MAMWKLQTLDNTETYVFPVNPNDMESPELPYTANSPMPSSIIGRRITGTNQLAVQTQYAVVATQAEPQPWSFSGIVYSLYDTEQMLEFMQYGQIKVTDHFGRIYKIVLQDLDFQRAPTQRYPQRHTYQAHCMMLGRI